jgi:glycosyltransferase involved in cell wall biosynthesis
MSALKKKYKNLCTCIIVSDLSDASGSEKQVSSLKNTVKKYHDKLQYKYVKAADSHILLKKEMVDLLDLEGKPYVIVEEISDANKDHTNIKPADNSVIIIKNQKGETQIKKILEMLQETMWNKTTPDNRVDFHVNDGDVRNFNLIMDYDEGKNKILQINITSQYGSTGRKVEEIHNFLVENRHLSYIAYSAYRSDIENAFKIENALQNYMRRFLNRILGRKYAHSALGTLRLIRKIKKIGPDLIHLHNIELNCIHFPMFMKFLKEYGVPVVYTLNDCWAFTGGCHHFTELSCKGYKIGCRECTLDRKHRDIRNRTPERIYDEKNNALHALKDLQIICVSKWIKSCAEQSFMKDLPLQVIYNGVDTSLFKPVISKKREELKISNNDFVILGVANNWDERKGLNTFFKLSLILNPPYRIVLVGLTEDSCPPNILAVPRTDSIQELVELYSCADVLLNASKEETLGLVTAEAMACGTPVIAYQSTVCSEAVSKDTGILLNNSRVEDLLIAIENVRRNGKTKYQKQCVDHIHRNFSKEKMLYHYLKVYDQMIIKSEVV